MDRFIEVSLTVNGEAVSARVDARTHLVDFLRDTLDLTGSHAGCEHGVCGACTLKLDGDIVRGCLVLAAQCAGSEVWTIEGLTEAGSIAALQSAFVARNALQCGFCTPGMLVAAADLLARDPDPSRETVRDHLSGNYCRCTGYHAIIDAVIDAAAMLRGA